MCSFPGGQRQVSLPLPFGLFLPAHPHRAIRAVFGPVGFRREHGPAYGAAFQLIPALADLGVQDRVRRFLIGFPLRILKPSLAGIG